MQTISLLQKIKREKENECIREGAIRQRDEIIQLSYRSAKQGYIKVKNSYENMQKEKNIIWKVSLSCFRQS